ncbi:MAG TPA: LON peptidase substrate-binding domain-containing protein [Myxococcota bacterium]|nr:LON peptidase substrate-binding domain-containing protein [Myxococcota bacterium]
MVGEPRVRTLPLFPLAQVVLFPRARVPLHVFEPRYRQMIAAVLAADRRLGMVAVAPEHTEELPGDPPLYSVGCVGVVTEIERLADGRYNLVLSGTERFRVRNELARPDDRLYRIAEVELLADACEPSEASRIAALRSRTVELLAEMLERQNAATARRSELLARRLASLDDATFADALCQTLSFPTPEKQGLLEADGAAARLESLIQCLRFRLAELAGGAQLSRTLQ